MFVVIVFITFISRFIQIYFFKPDYIWGALNYKKTSIYNHVSDTLVVNKWRLVVSRWWNLSELSWKNKRRIIDKAIYISVHRTFSGRIILRLSWIENGQLFHERSSWYLEKQMFCSFISSMLSIGLIPFVVTWNQFSIFLVDVILVDPRKSNWS